MKKQTAVEWLEQSLTKEFNKKMKDSIFMIKNCFENAKQIEKEQIKEAFFEGTCDGFIQGTSYFTKIEFKSAEDYYNKNYKNEL